MKYGHDHNGSIWMQAIKTAVVVLGMHRSGTSSVAGALVKLGVKGPKTPMIADAANERGYFESLAIQHLNDEILREAGSHWQDVREFRLEQIPNDVRDKLSAKASDILRSEFGTARTIVIKDPRMCRLMSFWSEAFDKSDFSIASVLPVRHPFEVAQSLHKVYGISPAAGLILWLRYVLGAEAWSRRTVRRIVIYPDYIPVWKKQLQILYRDFGLPWSPVAASNVAAVGQFLSLDLRHQLGGNDHELNHIDMRNWCGRAFAAMQRLADNPVSAEGQFLMDQIRMEFDQSTSIFFEAISELQEKEHPESAQLAAVHLQQDSAMKASSAKLRTENGELQQRIQERGEELEVANTQILELSHSNAAMQSVNDELRSQIATKGRELNLVQEQVEELRRFVAGIRSSNDALNLRLQQCQGELETERARASGLVDHSAMLQNKCEDLQADFAQQQRELEAAHALVESLNTSIGALNREVSQYQSSAKSSKSADHHYAAVPNISKSVASVALRLAKGQKQISQLARSSAVQARRIFPVAWHRLPLLKKPDLPLDNVPTPMKPDGNFGLPAAVNGHLVTLVGHPFSPIGKGREIRVTFHALRAVGIDVKVLNIWGGTSKDPGLCATINPFLTTKLSQVNIFHLNGDEIARALKVLGQLPHAINIVSPSWELERFPEEWADGIDKFDEVWAPSSFVSASIGGVVHCPILPMPLATEVHVSPFLGRRYFKIPEDEFAFLFAFDCRSYLARKNPDAVVSCFCKVLERRPQAKAILVVKVHGLEADAHDAGPLLAQLRGLNDRVVVIDKELTENETHNLIRNCDAMISLHRSEGFGLSLAEAMYLGLPVIATNYSGNLDFMSADNSYLVSHRMVAVGRREYPHGEHQSWAEPDLEQAAGYMTHLMDHSEEARVRGATASRDIRVHHSYRATGLRYQKRIRELQAAAKAQNL